MKGNEDGVVVPPIIYGVVINHLPPEMGEHAERMLQLKGTKRIVLKDVDSTKYGTKDMIKVDLSSKQFEAGKLEELVKLVKKNDGKLALISPRITIYVIKDKQVIEKWHPTVPEYVEGIVKCPNPNCLTQVDRHAVPYFRTTSRDPLQLTCAYCEKPMDIEQILVNLA